MRRILSKLTSRRGFSLAEIIVTVAIVGILATVAVIVGVNYSKSFKATEADDKAKAIYMSAQEHLTNMVTFGNWQEALEKAQANETAEFYGYSFEEVSEFYGTKITMKPSDYDYWVDISEIPLEAWTFAANNMYYLSTNDSEDADLLGLLIPPGSMAGVAEGQYIIEYNVKTAKIYGVFYCEETDPAIPYSAILAGLNEQGRANADVSESDAKSTRKNFKYNGESMILGYYGGAIASSYSSMFLPRPEITVTNGDDLAVTVRSYGDTSLYDLTVSVTGETSGEESFIPVDIERGTCEIGGRTCGLNYERYEVAYYNAGYRLSPENAAYEIFTGTVTDTVYNEAGIDGFTDVTIVLDSLTPFISSDASGQHITAFGNNFHFAGLFPGFIPGEDITIRAIVTPKDNSAMPRDASATVNSLFAALSDDGVDIRNIRHLENLSPDISGVNAGTKYYNGQALHFEKAAITKDISYSGYGPGESELGLNYMLTCILGKTDTLPAQTFYGGFKPINNTGLEELAGNGNRIYDLYIATDGAAAVGLLGTAGEINISGLGIVGSNALGDLTLEDYDPFTIYPNYVIEGTDSAGISTGAFIGEATGSVSFDGCYTTARISVNHDERVSAAGYVAHVGGFIGSATDAVGFSACYGGGIVDDEGFYDASRGNIELFTPSVSSESAALGSFVGYVEGSEPTVSITDSYSTQSLRLDTDADYVPDSISLGGFIGEISSESGDWGVELTNAYYAAPMSSNVEEVTYVQEVVRDYSIAFGGLLGRAEDGGDVWTDNAYYIPYFADFCGIPTALETQLLPPGVDTGLRLSSGDYTTTPVINTAGSGTSIGVLASDDSGLDGAFITAEAVLPVSPALDGEDFAFPDVTHLGHHYGDWQASVPGYGDGDPAPGDDPNPDPDRGPADDPHRPSVTIVKGHGVGRLEVEGNEVIDEYTFADLAYSQVIDISDTISVTLKDGYANPLYAVQPGFNGSNGFIGSFLLQDPDDTHICYVTGTSDTRIVISAATLLPPQLTMTGAGEYVYNYRDVNVALNNSRVYDQHSDIHIAYYLHRIDSSSAATARNRSITDFNSVTASQYWQAIDKAVTPSAPWGSSSSDVVISKTAYHGHKYYWAQAIAYDGVLTSQPVTTIAPSASVIPAIALLRAPVVIDANNFDSPPKDAALFKNGVNVGEKITLYAEYGSASLYPDSTSTSGAVTLVALSVTRSQRTFLGWYDDVYVDLDGSLMSGTDRIADTNGTIDGTIANVCGQGKWLPTTLNTINVYARWSQPAGNVTVDP